MRSLSRYFIPHNYSIITVISNPGNWRGNTEVTWSMKQLGVQSLPWDPRSQQKAIKCYMTDPKSYISHVMCLDIASLFITGGQLIKFPCSTGGFISLIKSWINRFLPVLHFVLVTESQAWFSGRCPRFLNFIQSIRSVISICLAIWRLKFVQIEALDKFRFMNSPYKFPSRLFKSPK